MLADVICNWKMTSFMALDGVMLVLRWKDIANTQHNELKDKTNQL